MIQLYLLSILLVLLPPFIVYGNPIFGTHSIAKIIWLGLFLFQLFSNRKQILDKYFSNRLIFLSFLFFLSQSISYFFSADKLAFFYGYEDLLFGYVFFLLSITLIKRINLNSLLRILSISFIFDIFYNMFMLVYPVLFFRYNKHLLEVSYLAQIKDDYFRNKIGIENFAFILLPILLYFLLHNKKNEIINFLLFLFNSFIILVGNYRTKSILLISISIPVFLMFRKKLIYYSLFILFLFMLSISTASIHKYQLSFANRYGISFTKENKNTLISRLKIWQYSLQIFKKYPFGVGLGNYQHYIVRKDTSQLPTISVLALYKDPHNIFIKIMVETGALGLSLYSLMMVSYLIYDFRCVYNKRNLNTVYIMCFWGLFIYSLFNPSSTIRYQMLFWFLRARIIL